MAKSALQSKSDAVLARLKSSNPSLSAKINEDYEDKTKSRQQREVNHNHDESVSGHFIKSLVNYYLTPVKFKQNADTSSSMADAIEHHWNEAKDSEGRSYYFNSLTGAVSWEIPDELLVTMPVGLILILKLRKDIPRYIYFYFYLF